MMLCGLLLFGFCSTVICDIVTREIGRPWLWLQEVTSTFFIYAIFIGTAVATRRNDHLYLTAIAEVAARHAAARRRGRDPPRRARGRALLHLLRLHELPARLRQSFRMPSMTPIASLYAAIPICGVLIALFTIEQLVNGLRNGFEHDEPPEEPMHVTPIDGGGGRPVMSGTAIVLAHDVPASCSSAMLGVPVAFSLLAGVLIGAMFTDVSHTAIIQKMFDGMDSEALLAIPFFLLVGELMSSANVVQRDRATCRSRWSGTSAAGLSQVVTVFSMFFSEMSGSTTADVAVISRALGGPMKREGYEPAFIAAIIAAASTIAALVPPSITAVVYGAIGNVSIAGLFMAGVVPGLMIGFGLMLYCYFFGPAGMTRPRSPFRDVARAFKDASLPMMIPVILLGGILTGFVHADRGRRRRGGLDHRRRDPDAQPRPHQEPAVGLLHRRADLLAAADHHRRCERLRLAVRLPARRDW